MSEDYGVIRPAIPGDAEILGRIFVRARDEMTYLPRISDEDRPKLGAWFLERHEVWVAEESGGAAGFAGLSPRWLDHLYVDLNAQNRGIGTGLLEQAKRLQPDGLRLWVFQKNAGARRFYERHGCRLVELTDGYGNEEREPDALYEWVP